MLFIEEVACAVAVSFAGFNAFVAWYAKGSQVFRPAKQASILAHWYYVVGVNGWRYVTR